MRTAILPAAFLCLCGAAAAADIGEKNLKFIQYPGFPEAHSTWGSIGYGAISNKVYIGVTNHRDRQGLYEYDVAGDKMTLCGFLEDMANLRDYQWQGKVHSKIVEGPDGAMYFTTDGGENREEFLMEHPHGFSGAYLFRWDPSARRLTSLGVPMQYDSVKDLAVDQQTGKVFMVSYPQVRLLLYDTKKNDLRDLGRVGSDHVPRVIFRDWWSNMYYVDWRQRLVKYEPATDKLIFARDSLPAFKETTGEQIVTGVTAYATDQPNGVIYLVTYGSKLLAFHPARQGIGHIEDLGGIFDAPGKAPNSYYCPNLALGANGKLYYFIGGHGMYAVHGANIVLMEYDPRAKTKRIVMTYPLATISEVTGSDVRDREGNLYFAGRKDDRTAARMGESGASRPFMIKFNPVREVR